jgi:hypothetical protein
MRGKHPVVVARVAEPGTATEPERIGAPGVEPRDRKESDQASCWSSGPRGFKSHPGRLTFGSEPRRYKRDKHSVRGVLRMPCQWI